MAFADATQKTILAGKFPQRITLGAGVYCIPGDLLGYNAAEWKLAEAATPVYAKAIAGEVGVPAAKITVYRSGMVQGFTDGTPGALLYRTAAGKFAAAAGGNPQIMGHMVTTTIGWVDTRWILDSAGNPEIADGAVITGSKLAALGRLHFARSQPFDMDGIGAATWDEIIFHPSVACTILRARIVHDVETSGIVAAGSVRLGTTLGGVDTVAATNFVNTQAVGTTTALVVAAGAVAAGTPIFLRTTGVAAVLAGWCHVEIEYTVDD